jgi:lysyl-tRNA synthetase class 2
MLPKRFPDREEIAAVRAEAEKAEPGGVLEQEHRVAGRVMARREMGKLTFLDLVDRSGRIQLISDKKVALDLGDIVGVTGKPGRSRRGEPSLTVTQLELLAKIRRPLPDTFHGVTDIETRYRQRYLDLLMSDESRTLVTTRTRIVQEVRAYLDGEGFLEVETPILQPRYGGGFAEPFVTHSNELDADLYLRIADELYLKRLIVGGLERVYELAKDFRNESISYKHSPEFTQVEWYEAYADYRDTMERTEALVSRAAEETGSTKVTFRGHDIDLAPPWERVKFVEALEAKGVWSRDEAELRAKLQEAGVDTDRDRSWSQLADHAYSHFVEPELIQPTIVHDWPIELSPFARTTDDDETIVERFECVVGGMEFANAFSELNDAEEQAQRFAMQEAEREAGAEESEPGDPEFVEALSYGMPPTGGCGIGIDRLTMVLTGSDAIRDVILFPALRSRE